MIQPNKSLFNDTVDNYVSSKYKYIFISDFYSDQLVGGAELTTDALINYNKEESYKINASKVSTKFLQNNLDKLFILGNVVSMNINTYQYLINFCNYVVIEYDYKLCKIRNPTLHKLQTKHDCDCTKTEHGKFINLYIKNAKQVFWMSQKQLELQKSLFKNSNLNNLENNFILSSVFEREHIEYLNKIKKQTNNSKYLVLKSNNDVKGTNTSIEYCKVNNLTYDVIGDLKPLEFLDVMSNYKGIVYMPKGEDTCPRMLIEAKILGLEIISNNLVQHTEEDWYNSSHEELVEYLLSRPSVFWEQIKNICNNIENRTISGYTTTYNCISNEYPYVQSIISMTKFCDEVIVMDGGSNDGTYEKLLELSNNYKNIKVYQNKIDIENDSSYTIDGLQKAKSREKATMEFCWQMDVDEIVHESDVKKIKSLLKNFPNEFDIVALPVIEFWGNKGKIRTDINIWKWRLSRNKEYITHGIPDYLRYHDENGILLSKPGSDGCDMINKYSFKPINSFCDFVNNINMNFLFQHHKKGSSIDEECINKFFETISIKYPVVYHFSWFDLPRKIRFYKNFWQKHWNKLFGSSTEDTKENNYMFDKEWSNVTEDDIIERANIFENELCGWIWHKKWDGTKTFGINSKNISNINKKLDFFKTIL